MSMTLPPSSLSLEMAFLLGCLQGYFHGDLYGSDLSERSLPALGSGRAWAALLDMARRHAVIPHLYHSLRAIDVQGVPPASLEESSVMSRR